MYWKRSWQSKNGRARIIDKYHSHRAEPKNPLIKEKRRKGADATTPTQEQVNLRQRVDKLTRLLLDNFSTGDWWITFTMREKETVAEFRKEYARMIRRLRDAYRRAGHELRYISVLENLGGRGRPHGHIIINNVQEFSVLRKLMKKSWQLGECCIKPYGGDVMDARRLAAYMSKEDTVGKAIREKRQLLADVKRGKEKGSEGKKRLEKLESIIIGERSRICPSTNLVRTEPKKEMIRSAETYRDEIRPPRGYHLVKALSYNGWTREGYRYQHAVFERDDDEEERSG